MIETLINIVHPPDAPIDVNEALLTDKTGIEFPSDFLEYSRTFGTGTISVGVYEWEIYSAFRRTLPDFVKRFYLRQDAFRKAAETQSLPLGLYPEPNGLLPFGHRDDVYFCWRTDGKPDLWTVCVIWEYQEGGYQFINKNFVGFLVSLLTREFVVAGFKSNWDPKTDITFTTDVYSC